MLLVTLGNLLNPGYCDDDDELNDCYGDYDDDSHGDYDENQINHVRITKNYFQGSSSP